jgi:hypothetical protein
MSDRGFEFAHAWIAEHAAPTVYQEDGDRGEANLMAKDLIDDAQSQGISKQEIEEAVGDIEDFLADALNEATDRHIDRQ